MSRPTPQSDRDRSLGPTRAEHATVEGSASFWRDPSLPWVDSRRACNSRACYRPHSHPSFSIGAVDHGHSRFTGAPEGAVALTPGTLVFVRAHRGRVLRRFTRALPWLARITGLMLIRLAAAVMGVMRMR